MTVLAGKTAGQTSWLDCAVTPCFPCSEQLSLEAGQHRGGPLSSALRLFISLLSCSLVLPLSHSDWCYWDERVAETANRPLKWKTNLRKQAWMDFHTAFLNLISSPPLFVLDGKGSVERFDPHSPHVFLNLYHWLSSVKHKWRYRECCDPKLHWTQLTIIVWDFLQNIIFSVTHF